jgi:pimeloyl-ACP methyl ester carboxylesterase
VAGARAHCEAITRDTGQKPIVIGHSMGGLIAQALACEGSCSSAVFITPVPPAAIVNRSLWALFLFANVLISGKHDRYHKAWKAGVDTVLLNRVPRRDRSNIYSRMRYEPGQVYVDMMQSLPLKKADLAVPALAISAGRDRIVSPKIVRRTADHHHGPHHSCDLRHYPAHGHWIIDEPGNHVFVSDVAAWLMQRVDHG